MIADANPSSWTAGLTALCLFPWTADTLPDTSKPETGGDDPPAEPQKTKLNTAGKDVELNENAWLRATRLFLKART